MDEPLESDGETGDALVSDGINSAVETGDWMALESPPAEAVGMIIGGAFPSVMTSPSESLNVVSSLALESDPAEEESDSDAELPQDSDGSQEDVSSDDVDGSDEVASVES